MSSVAFYPHFLLAPTISAPQKDPVKASHKDSPQEHPIKTPHKNMGQVGHVGQVGQVGQVGHVGQVGYLMKMPGVVFVETSRWDVSTVSC